MRAEFVHHSRNSRLVDFSEAIDAVRRLPPSGAITREAARLRRDELDGSLAIGGTPLSRVELDALCDQGTAAGGHAFAAYVEARDLAAASAWVSEQRSLDAGDPRPLITIEDVRRLHVVTTASQPELRSGAWRLNVEPSSPGGIVYPAPWLVAAEMSALVDRFPPAARARRCARVAGGVPRTLRAHPAVYRGERTCVALGGIALARASRAAAACDSARARGGVSRRDRCERGAQCAAVTAHHRRCARACVPTAHRERRCGAVAAAAHACRRRVCLAGEGGEAWPARCCGA